MLGACSPFAFTEVGQSQGLSSGKSLLQTRRQDGRIAHLIDMQHFDRSRPDIAKQAFLDSVAQRFGVFRDRAPATGDGADHFEIERGFSSDIEPEIGPRLGSALSDGRLDHHTHRLRADALDPAINGEFDNGFNAITFDPDVALPDRQGRMALGDGLTEGLPQRLVTVVAVDQSATAIAEREHLLRRRDEPYLKRAREIISKQKGKPQSQAGKPKP